MLLFARMKRLLFHDLRLALTRKFWNATKPRLQMASFSTGHCKFTKGGTEGLRWRISKHDSLMDEPVIIRVAGLPGSAPVTLGLRLYNEEEKLNFSSASYYTTNMDGILDLDMQETVKGRYNGIDPMYPFWNMKPHKDWQDRYLVRDVTKTQIFDAHLCIGHIHQEEVFSSGKDFRKHSKVLGCTTIKRHYMGPGVRRIPIAEDGVFGTVFLPAESAEGPRPLVLTIYGGIHRGGVIEEKAAVLASRGFATFAVGYFGVGTLPKRYGDIEIEYFEKAINLVCQKYPKEIDEKNIGIVGISKGGDITLSCAAFLPHLIKSVVAINCSLTSIAFKTTYKDNTVQGLGFHTDASNVKFTDDGLIDVLGTMNDVKDYPETIIPFYKSPTNILWFAGDDDHNFDSTQYVRMAAELAEKEGKTNFSHHIFPGCGHLVDLPFSPPATSSLHPLAPPGAKLYMGGAHTIQLHVAAQVHIWRKSLNFLRKTLMTKNGSKL